MRTLVEQRPDQFDIAERELDRVEMRAQRLVAAADGIERARQHLRTRPGLYGAPRGKPGGGCTRLVGINAVDKDGKSGRVVRGRLAAFEQLVPD